VALLIGQMLRESLRSRSTAVPFGAALVRQLDGLFGMGLVLVGLVHVPMGSFLAMQAYFHATFTQAVGAVVGLGLVRNLGPLTTGLILAGLLAARIVPELRCQPHDELDREPGWVPDRDGRSEPAAPPSPARVAAVRIVAAVIAGPVLGLWGTLIGTVVGLFVARAMLGVEPAIYLGKIHEMIEPIDAMGILLKGSAYAFAAALFACHEGLRPGSSAAAVRMAVFRATCISIVAVLAINATWFTLAHMAGSPFGPQLSAVSRSALGRSVVSGAQRIYESPSSRWTPMPG
jgi:phospholipid/cholesterol/gamma-HCH transport system permease protein